MSKGGLPLVIATAGIFLDFQKFLRRHGRFHSKGFKEMVLKGREVNSEWERGKL